MKDQIAQAVIGAAYGDEGKGLAVDAISAALIAEGRAVTVVRSNGGAQAGHTIVAPDGRRHVFHHVCAGSFAGADSHLSAFFVANPMVLQSELKDLKRLGVTPRITIDPMAQVTTPWDMLINQIAEVARGGARHGSCGLGFGETLERQGTKYDLTVANLAKPGLADRLAIIRDEWVDKRLMALGVTASVHDHIEALASPHMIDRFMQDCTEFLASIDLASDADLGQKNAVVFEAAQGLRLDQDYGDFPYVTRSHTGIRNILTIAEKAGIGHIEALYMTRAYTTRHGAGPLAHEVASLPFGTVVDETNMPNAWQGSLRFAPLDPAGLAGLIQKDLNMAHGAAVTVSGSVGISCLDQIAENADVVRAGKVISIASSRIPQVMAATTGLPVGLVSQGPTRADVDLNFTSFNGKAPYFSAGMRVLGIAAIFTYPLDFAKRKSKYAV